MPRIDGAGFSQVGVGQNRGHSGGEVGQNEHGKRRKIGFSRNQPEMAPQDFILGQEKAMRPHEALRLAGASAGEGEQRFVRIGDLLRRKGSGVT